MKSISLLILFSAIGFISSLILLKEHKKEIPVKAVIVGKSYDVEQTREGDNIIYTVFLYKPGTKVFYVNVDYNTYNNMIIGDSLNWFNNEN